MKYKNPIINQDFSDPDVIPYKNGFLMITSSFNFVPGLPLYYSEDLVNFKLINYIFPTLPGKKFNKVHFGHGIWAPSIRQINGTLYVLAPFPDEGIYVSHTRDPFSSWSRPHLLLKGKGYEDPCPIVINNRVYVVFAFVKSRIGFNSKLALMEVDDKLEKVITPYKIIYSGEEENKTIEGPKFYKRGEYIYILAPAGGVEHGYQLAMRSKNVEGPYEWKIVLKEFPDTINGPHQGAMVEYKKDKYVFYHFQDAGPRGRVLHLQPAIFIDDWPIFGEIRGDVGAPIAEHEYYLKPRPFKTKSMFFKDGKKPEEFQTPCNPLKNGYQESKDGFIMNILKTEPLPLTQNALYMPLLGRDFKMICDLEFNNSNLQDEGGLIILGNTSYALRIIKQDKDFALYFDVINDTLHNKSYIKRIRSSSIRLKLEVRDLNFSLTIGNTKIGTYPLIKGNWVGTKIGVYTYTPKNNLNVGKMKIKQIRII